MHCLFKNNILNEKKRLTCMRRLMNVCWQTRHHLQWHKVENRQSYLFIFTLYKFDTIDVKRKQPKKLDARKTIKIMQHLAKVYQRKVDVNKGLLWLYWRCQFRTFGAILNSLRFPCPAWINKWCIAF